MFAELSGLGSGRVTCFDAEDVGAHEVVPFDNLLECFVVSSVGWEGVGEDETSEGISSLISTMRVHLASTIIRLDVNKRLVNMPNDLNICRGLHKLNTGKRAGRDDPRPTPWFGTPGDSLAFSVPNNSIWFGWAPEAKVIDRVNHGGLAFRGRALGGGVAAIIPLLRSTVSRIGVGLIREVGIVKLLLV